MGKFQFRLYSFEMLFNRVTLTFDHLKNFVQSLNLSLHLPNRLAVPKIASDMTSESNHGSPRGRVGKVAVFQRS